MTAYVTPNFTNVYNVPKTANAEQTYGIIHRNLKLE